MGGEVAVTASLLRRGASALHFAAVPASAAVPAALASTARHAARGAPWFEHASYAAVLATVVLASFLQALGAAMRKLHGGHLERYWTSPQWWTAFGVTMSGGLLALVVMPYVTVVVFVPVTTTVQVTSNFLFGVFYFGETVHHFQFIGLCSAVLGAVCVNLQRGQEAADPWQLDDFWASWIEERFLQFNLCWAVFLLGTRLAFDRAFHYAFLAGYTSTLTYICMRSVSFGFGDLQASLTDHAWWGAVVLGLLVFNLLTVHVQQLMLRGPLSLVEAIFGASQTLIGVTTAGVYFREESVYDNALFAVSTLLTAGGLVLLAAPLAMMDKFTPRMTQPCMQRDEDDKWKVPLLGAPAERDDAYAQFAGGTPKNLRSPASSPAKSLSISGGSPSSPRLLRSQSSSPAPR